jgi:hypothetical protein
MCVRSVERKDRPATFWFLIAKNRWEDKLNVLQWNESLAAHEGIQSACSPAHVQELVVHWMTTGSLDYPFARTSLGAGPARRCGDLLAAKSYVDLSGARQIGELAVHRESVERVLVESPQSLKVILDALLAALRHETAPTEAGARSENAASCVLAPEVEV